MSQGSTVTARLHLRSWSRGDLDALEGILGDPEVMRHSLSGPLERAARQAWLAERIAHQDEQGPAQHGPMHRAICLRGSEHAIGYASLTPIDQDAELGVRLARGFWGRGIAQEGAGALIARAQQSGSFARIIAHVDPSNTRSVRLMQALGFQHAGDVMLPGYDYPDRRYVLQLNPLASAGGPSV